MDFRHSFVGAALWAASAFTGNAQAALTGNGGVFSEYLFRGVEQSNGVAVQGGLDYSHELGFYAGTWISNLDAGLGFGSYETDIYGGYTTRLFDLFNVDAGLLYYYYADVSAPNTLEGYLGVTAGPVSVKGSYTQAYFGSSESAFYVTANTAYSFTDTLALIPQVGFSAGDGVKALFKKDYVDYSLNLAKTWEYGITLSFGAFGTSIDGDDLKLLLGVKKTFELL